MEVIMLDGKEPAPKKLKQSRLPFQILAPKVKIGEHVSGKKRKLSGGDISEATAVKHSKPAEPKQKKEEAPIVIDLDVNTDDEQEPLGERESNQPDISTIFKKVIPPETIDATSQNVSKKCFVDLSECRVEAPEKSSDVEMQDNEEESSEEASECESNDTVISVDTSVPVQDNKENLDMSVTENDKESTSSFMAKLTPKQLQRKLESQKRHEERERQKLEKLEQKRKEREEKEEQRKKEREEKEEQRKKEREEKEDQKRKEREEKERKRKQEIDQKNEEKRKKEELKETERKKKEQEQEELKKKQMKTSQAFVKFFVPKNSDSPIKPSGKDGASDDQIKVEKKSKIFMPFAVKSDMRIAPLVRTNFDVERKKILDKELNKGIEKDKLYLSEITNGTRTVGKSERTWQFTSEDDSISDDVVCIDAEDANAEVGNEILIGELAQPTLPTKMRVKLLQFQENRRPPYWGTWRKRSTLIKPRRPIGTDSVIFDYDIDSDEEWEEEEPGESLRGSDDEKDSDCDEKENEYDIDNEFMVPHGYLSEEEEALIEEDGQQDETIDENDDNHKQKLKALEIEFQAERNEKTERLRPRIFGCIWTDNNNQTAKTLPESMKRYFYNHQILFSDPVILSTKDANEFVTTNSPSQKNNENSPVKKVKWSDIPEKYYPDFIRLLHGNTNGKLFLFKEFKIFLLSVEENLHIGRKRFDNKIKALASWEACPEEGPMHNRVCWYVSKEVREKYGCSELSLPNSWNYILTPKRPNIPTQVVEPESEKKIVAASTPINAITKFTKVLTEEERQKAFEKIPPAISTVTSTEITKSPAINTVNKKRVTLTTLSNTCNIFKKVTENKNSNAETDSSKPEMLEIQPDVK